MSTTSGGYGQPPSQPGGAGPGGAGPGGAGGYGSGGYGPGGAGQGGAGQGGGYAPGTPPGSYGSGPGGPGSGGYGDGGYGGTSGGPSGSGWGGSDPSGPSADDAKGFFAALFDFSFGTFITPKIIKFLYILITILLALGYLGFVISSFQASIGLGIVVLLIVGPIMFFIYLMISRIYLELAMSIIRMSEDTHHIRNHGLRITQ